MMRKAKIVCTIGPASDSTAVLDQLIASGMNVARLNFSHGTHDSHGRAVKSIREAAARQHAAVAILQDLQGPRIRVGDLPEAGIEVAADQRVVLRGGALRSGGQMGARRAERARAADVPEIPVTYAFLARDVRPGARILIDDGLVELVVTRVAGETVECTVAAGGRIGAHKGVNLPGTRVGVPTITEKDREDLRFGIAQGVDYLALSFVRGAEDVVTAKRLVAEYGGDVPVIAKIERPEAVDCLDAVLEQADGVMIARGDLGVEMGPEAVPLLQKKIIAEANRRRRLVITATQMLESMIRQPRPTRAEVSDVANAVLDGTDAVMLSAETAIGRYPVEALRVADRIVRAAEAGDGGADVRMRASDPGAGSRSSPDAMCAAASLAASSTTAAAVVAWSESGTTALLMSKQRPPAPILGFTPFEPVRRRMALYWGVAPYTMAQVAKTDEMVQELERRLKAEKLITRGERIVILSGTKVGQPGGTNLMKLHEVA
jgi:pyruvate kinase